MVLFFNPLKVNTFYPKQIYIERAIVDGETKTFQKNLNLNKNTYRVDLFIDVPYFANNDNVIIYAKLNNTSDAKWELVGKDRKYTISGLGHGDYIFSVRVLASDKGKYIYNNIKISLPAYFYQTTWFKSLICIFFGLIIYLSVKWRINFLKKKNDELEKIVEDRTKNLSNTVNSLELVQNQLHNELELQKKLIGTITHDITSPVKFITLITDDILQKKENNLETITEILNTINKSSNQLYNFTTTLKKYADIYNNESKYEIKEYSLYDLIQEKKKLFAEIAKSRNTEILNNISKNSTTIISKNILSAIIHNLLDNAVKFTKDGIIIFGSSEKEDSLIITLRDSGIGMDPDKIEYYNNLQKNTGKEKLVLQKYGMGLHFIMQLLQMIDGFIIIEKLDRGTSFKLLLKKQKDE